MSVRWIEPYHGGHAECAECRRTYTRRYAEQRVCAECRDDPDRPDPFFRPDAARLAREGNRTVLEAAR